MTVFDLIDKEIADEHDSLLTALSAGHVKDYAEYKYICGVISGLLGLKNYINSIRENLEDEEIQGDEDIPQEAANLLFDYEWSLEKQIIVRHLEEGDAVKAIDAIEDVLKGLYRTQRRLVDVQSILVGYANVQAQAENELQDVDISLDETPELFDSILPSEETKQITEEEKTND